MYAFLQIVLLSSSLISSHLILTVTEFILKLHKIMPVIFSKLLVHMSHYKSLVSSIMECHELIL